MPIFIDDGSGIAKEEKIFTDLYDINYLENLFIKTIEESKPILISTIIFPIILAAIIDSINPCAFSVLLVLLTLVFYNLDRKKILRTGFSFILSVYISYFLIGLGLVQTFTFFIYIKYIVATFAIITGLLSIIEFFFGEKKNLPCTIAKRVSNYLENVTNPKTAFFAGVATATLLMPCSSAPYFLAINLISEKSTFFEGIILLGIYNFIIVTPLILITLGVRFFGIKRMEFTFWIREQKNIIKLITEVLRF